MIEESNTTACATQNEEGSGENGGFEGIVKSGSAYAGNEEESFYCLTIIGQIEGHYVLDNTQKATKYDHLIPLLVALEENDKIDGVLIILNTMGGDVEAGLALAELIASMQKPTVTLVLGGGHSIGVPLAVAGRVSFIVPSATMTIHPVRTTGLVLGVPQAFDYLQRMQDRIIHFITEHSRVDEGYLRTTMTRTDQMANDIGAVINGQEAVACGLIDHVGGLADALGCLRKMTKESKKSKEKGRECTCSEKENVIQ
ncbi:MAG: ATP-dependent Clp protease proteolytic subunit [Clostridia bacterium]|nr:ATP-dependent Clp protease proteolytic subunit [Clostridia bacterium]